MRQVFSTFIQSVIVTAICGASASASGMVDGYEYLHQAQVLQASIVRSAGNETTGSYSTQTEDIAGSLSGTIGAGTEQSAVIVGDGRLFIVSFGKSSLPPLGANIRALIKPAKLASDKTIYSVIVWAFGSDVARAEATPKKRQQSVPAVRSKVLASRGGTSRIRMESTKYFRDYANAIKGFNSRLSDQDVNDITTVLLRTSMECDMDPRLVMAVILAESGFNPSATSPKGAAGLGQLMPGTARGMGVTDPYDSKQSVEACVRLIRSGLNKYSGKAAWKDLNWSHLRLALAAYNAGSGAVKKYGGIPPYRETQNYIAKVSSYYKQLCQK